MVCGSCYKNLPDYDHAKYAGNGWLCPMCYKEIMFEIVRGVRETLERVAIEYGVSNEAAWDVFAMEIDTMGVLWNEQKAE